MLFTCTEENSSRWDIGKVNSTYSICFSKIVTHDAKMNVMRMVHFSLDIICTCWVLRKSKWTCGRNSVRVQYPVVIWAVKARLLMWEHRALFLGLFEGRVVLLLVGCCPVTMPVRMAACAVCSLLVWIQWIWRKTGIGEYFPCSIKFYDQVPSGHWQCERDCFTLLWLLLHPFFFTLQPSWREILQVRLNIS